jgi:1,2-dihydroxy-3-keto-5-methylthiopentene dioxygenase
MITLTTLQIMSTDGTTLRRTDDAADIRTVLAPYGINLEQWQASHQLSPLAGEEEVLTAYRADVDRICQTGGYRLVDVVRMQPDDTDPEWPAKADTARQKFLNEHIHDEDEVRYFVDGKGCFYLHLDDRVYAVICEAGDLLSVPKGTRHWFDMGTRPQFCAIRFFEEPDGWVGNFTGDPIASRIPYLDELLAPAA